MTRHGVGFLSELLRRIQNSSKKEERYELELDQRSHGRSRGHGVARGYCGMGTGTDQNLMFTSTISGTPGITNFFVDDVSLTCTAGPVPTMPSWALAALVMAL